MPLLHQDNRRGGGSPSDRQSRSHRSVSEILDSMVPDNVRAPAVARNECGVWWDSPASPEAAQTPGSLVPAACFPPQHPRAYTSFSECAQPGGGASSSSAWNGSSPHVLHNGRDHGIQDLMTSLKALSMVSTTAALATEGTGNVSPLPQNAAAFDTEQWSTDQPSKGVQLRDNKRTCGVERRRASFCGAVGNGCSVLRWSGRLPARTDDPEGGFSAKLFIGGLPWDITESALTHALKPFQPVHMEWPERAQGCSPRGFAYVTFDSEKRVRALLAACRRDRCEWYYRLQSRKMRCKEVQVIPWAVADANWSAVRSTRLEASRTVFVGALHGMLSAGTLAMIMNDLFSGVVYAGIDTDKNKYPIGSGRVTFDNVRSYVRAISAAYIEIHTDKFTKKVQIDPYLEDSMCTVCNLQQGPYFCREPICFGYFCRSCWSWQHGTDSGLESHKELVRNSKSSALASSRPVLPPAPGGSARPALAPSPAYVSQQHEYGLFNGHYAVGNEINGSQSPPASATSGICSATSDADPMCEDRVLWHDL